MATSENRLVHLDLKGTALKVDYLEQLFPLLSEWGVSGLLIEWEDTFPYSGRLASIGSLSSTAAVYSEADVRRIHSMASDNNLTVIPLVQTFGHLEFVLKLPQWQALREVPRFPAALCPHNPLSLPLVTDMLDQVLELTPAARYIHIGADEVWHLGKCSECSKKSKPRVFLSHVMGVLHHLHDKHPHVQPIMWDDMLRDMEKSLLDEYKIGDAVEPMIWHYNASSLFCLTEDMWDKYSQVFARVWIASAFKGATGSCQLLPVITHHISNHHQWLAVVDNVTSRFQRICGIALTGWSRYDHFATLCELLPPSLPSLALCLRSWAVRLFDQSVHHSVSKELGYTDYPISLNPYPRPQLVPQNLSFPGWKIAVGVEWLANLRAKHVCITESDKVQTWLNPWQIENNFTNPMQIEGLATSFNELEREWHSLDSYLSQHLPEVYYEKTIDEWLGSLVRPRIRAIRELCEIANRQLQLASTS